MNADTMLALMSPSTLANLIQDIRQMCEPSGEHLAIAADAEQLLIALVGKTEAEMLTLGPTNEGCALCKRPAPREMDELIAARWIPYFYRDQVECSGPVCADCVRTKLRLAEDCEWELVSPVDTARDPSVPAGQAGGEAFLDGTKT